jgi:coatomer protein complex subunit gamma
MIRVVLLQVIAESGSPSGSEARPYYDFLETCLRHKAEMVIFEAARAICEMRDVSSRCVSQRDFRADPSGG